jgi:hypothetical protein
MIVLHDQERKKSDASGASGDADFGDFASGSGGLAGGCEEQTHDERSKRPKSLIHGND